MIDFSACPLIDGSNYKSFAVDPIVGTDVKSRGRVPRDWQKDPLLSGRGSRAMEVKTFSEKELKEIFREKKKAKARTVDRMVQAGMKAKDQKRTNYCWIFATTQGAQLLRINMGLPYVELSPASIGCKIKNFRNEGGWGSEGLRYAVNAGWSTSELWPDAAIDRRYDTPAADAVRPQFQVDEWYDLTPKRNNAGQAFMEAMTLVALGIPVSAGYDWWGHQILIVDGDENSKGDIEAIILNSWSPDWGEQGCARLDRERATPDDAVAPRVVTASDGTRAVASTQVV